ncbi:butyrophilin 2 isoform X1 [Pelobates cultripes]|uniref:Butyrophilin 2 isoform X1 n=1 Tax=Pelobates cultripes TaxID=61616 RepID=A0AAD1SQP5_PELCU|nr:butyrophilin 2 isoform X1 [Pelobates cultripes]
MDFRVLMLILLLALTGYGLQVMVSSYPEQASVGSSVLLPCAFRVRTHHVKSSLFTVIWKFGEKILLKYNENDKETVSDPRVSLDWQAVRRGEVSLSLHHVTTADEGTYTCMVIYGNEHQEGKINLYVQGYGLQVMVSSYPEQASVGSSVLLPCAFRVRTHHVKSSLLTVIWKFAEKILLKYNENDKETFSDARVSLEWQAARRGEVPLSLHHVTTADEGTYTCMVIYGNEHQEGKINLYVQGPVQISPLFVIVISGAVIFLAIFGAIGGAILSNYRIKSKPQISVDLDKNADSKSAKSQISVDLDKNADSKSVNHQVSEDLEEKEVSKSDKCQGPVVEDIVVPRFLHGTEATLQCTVRGLLFPNFLKMDWVRKPPPGLEDYPADPEGKYREPKIDVSLQEDHTFTCTARLIIFVTSATEDCAEYVCRVTHPSLESPQERRTGKIHVTGEFYVSITVTELRYTARVSPLVGLYNPSARSSSVCFFVSALLWTPGILCILLYVSLW